MKKWLIGLSVFSGLALAVFIRSKLKQKRSYRNFMQGITHVEKFLKKIYSGSEMSMQNIIIFLPNEGGSIDCYFGEIEDEKFCFQLTSAPSAEEETKNYMLQWSGYEVSVTIYTVDTGPVPELFENIHCALKNILQEANDSQPS